MAHECHLLANGDPPEIALHAAVAWRIVELDQAECITEAGEVLLARPSCSKSTRRKPLRICCGADRARHASEVIAGKDARTLAEDLLATSQDEFSAAFRKPPMKRAKLIGLQRNATIVRANVGKADSNER